MFWLLYLFFLFKPVSLLKFCDEPTVVSNKLSYKIIGGRDAADSEFPFQSLLVSYNSSGQGIMCGATVIDDYWLLTAGHCVQQLLEKTYVLLGVETINNPKFTLKVARTITHPGYSSTTGKNDIALIQTKRSTARKGIMPVCLVRDDRKLLEENPKGVVTGFGLRIVNSTSTSTVLQRSDVLMKTTVPIIPDLSCKLNWKRLSFGAIAVGSQQICAGSLLHGTAPGDSGGPLLVRNRRGDLIQVGITSFGADGLEALFDQETYPGVYTRVSSYISWIEKYVNSSQKSGFMVVLGSALWFLL